MAENALLLSEKIRYSYGTGYSFLNLGHVYWSQSYYPISLFYLKSALTYIPKSEHVLLSMCYNATGRTYMELKNFEEANRALDASAKYAEDDQDAMGQFYSEKALLYIRTGAYDKAVTASKQALLFFRMIKDSGNVNIAYTRLGTIYRHQKEYKKTLDYADTSFRMSFKTGNKRLRAKMYIEYADIYNELGQYDKAINYALKGDNL
jgi:tetratricopeptide (TPR) repeat protein